MFVFLITASLCPETTFFPLFSIGLLVIVGIEWEDSVGVGVLDIGFFIAIGTVTTPVSGVATTSGTVVVGT